jgi:hypothetical protein
VARHFGIDRLGHHFQLAVQGLYIAADSESTSASRPDAASHPAHSGSRARGADSPQRLAACHLSALWRTDPLPRGPVDGETISRLPVLRLEPANEEALTRVAAVVANQKRTPNRAPFFDSSDSFFSPPKLRSHP